MLHAFSFYLYKIYPVRFSSSFLQVIEFLIKFGADPCQQDCDRNTVVHSIICQAYYHPQHESRFVVNIQHFLALLTDKQLKSLFKMENYFGLRPVEFAAQLGLCELLQAFMDIPGVYLYRVENYGMTQYRYYDVTDYESTSGRPSTKSPLTLLTFTDEPNLHKNTYQQLHSNSSLFAKWYEAKFLTNIPMISIVAALQVLYIACYLVYDMDTSFYGKQFDPDNSTKHCRPKFAPVMSSSVIEALQIIMMIFSSISVLMVVYEIIKNFSSSYWPLYNTIDGRKKLKLHHTVYRWSSLLFSITVIINIALQVTVGKEAYHFYELSRVICPILAIWQILAVLQLLPRIGHFVITVQAILEDVMHFMIIYSLFIIPFLHSFQTIINTNTNTGCYEEFTTVFGVLYSVFLTTLNMVDFTSYDIRNQELLYVSHISFTFVVSILMANFFIAILSSSVNRISKNKHVALNNQRSYIAFLMESWYGRVFKGFYLNLKRKHFKFEKDKILIVTVRTLYKFD